MNNDYEVLEVVAPSVQQLDAIERANVDTQVSTAKQYPRNIKRSLNNAIAIVTMDEGTAQSCTYALPRGGKPITGPSVHLAKIISQCYGNIRAEAKVVEITDKHVVSRGTAWDLENNYAVAFEVRRSIVGNRGRFNDDMITVTGNAANAIAYRNAVLSVVPKSITDRVYHAAQELITGDLSDDTKLIARRKKAIDMFKDEFNISEDELVKLCGKQTVNQIKKDEIALLLGFYQSLKDGDTTVDTLLKEVRGISTTVEQSKATPKEMQKYFEEAKAKPELAASYLAQGKITKEMYDEI
ncbi:hypothetical protein [Dysgonomonas massiliensis]|uniref:hypothetical protein n=1 Tax=Dysgonomonas massiliensis TaxID=2040292 RepID=UPI000C77A893|nr:hypothetical protein [Dysgonomonas massiliensis]